LLIQHSKYSFFGDFAHWEILIMITKAYNMKITRYGVDVGC